MEGRDHVPVRWDLVLLPALFVGAFEYIRHRLFLGLPTAVGNLGAALLAMAGSVAYYRYAFGLLHRAAASLQAERQRQAILEERERMAETLHDSMAQTLFFLNAQLSRAQSALARGDTGEARQHLTEAQQGLHFAHRDLRETIAALKGAGREEPFASALQGLVAEQRRQSALEIALSTSGPVEEVPPAVRRLVLTFVRESLTNVRKHARARSARVSIDYRASDAGDRAPKAIDVAVEDDGIGFDPKRVAPGFGLARLQEQAVEAGGCLLVERASLGGAAVRLRLPLPRREAGLHGVPRADRR